MEELFIPIIIGTTRKQRKSHYAAQLLNEVAGEYSFIKTQIIDPNDFIFLGDGNDQEGKDSRYSDITKKADGFFIVVPEYNHSFPGSLKRMLDSELENYNHKAVAFAGTSSGSWGGVRAIESLVSAVREMGLVATYTDMHFPRIQSLFDDNGTLIDQKYRENAKKAWNELIWMTRVLKVGREKSE